MTYKSLFEVVEAARAGTLPAGSMIIVDNDSIYLSPPSSMTDQHGSPLDGAPQLDDPEDPGPSSALIDLLTALGVPAGPA